MMEFLPLTGRFNLWLRRYREGQDLSRNELAERIGCSVETIENYEQGRTLPSKPMATRIGQVISYPDGTAFVNFARQGRLDGRELLPRSVKSSTSSTKITGEEWPVLTREQFKNNHNRWGLGLKDDGTGMITRSMLDGAYCLMLIPKHKNGCFLGGDSAFVAPPVFFLTVEIEQVDGPSNGMAGIYFEELHDSQQIVFHARFGTQEFAIASLKDGGNHIERIVSWQPRLDVIHKAQNTFGLLCEHEHFTFFINSVEVAAATIVRTPGARLDIGIGGITLGQRVVFLYRNFTICVPSTKQ